jgi:hypothetical protein
LIDGIIVNIVAVVVVLLLDALTNIWVTGLFTGLRARPGGRAQAHGPAVGDPQCVDAAAHHPVHRRPAGVHRDRGDDQ